MDVKVTTVPAPLNGDKSPISNGNGNSHMNGTSNGHGHGHDQDLNHYETSNGNGTSNGNCNSNHTINDNGLSVKVIKTSTTITNGINGNHSTINGNGHGHGNGNSNGNSNGYTKNGHLSDTVENKETQLHKFSVKNGDHFIRLNGQEREITWNDVDEDAREEGHINGHGKSNGHTFKVSLNKSNKAPVTAQEIQDAVNEAEKISQSNGGNGDTAGIIIFKDQNGVAPPLTMTILKNGSNGTSTTTTTTINGNGFPTTQMKNKIKSDSTTKPKPKPTPSPSPSPSPSPDSDTKRNFDQTFTSSTSTLTLDDSSDLKNGVKGDNDIINGHEYRTTIEQFPPIVPKKIESVNAESAAAVVVAAKEENGASFICGPEASLRKQLKSVTQRKKDDQRAQFESLKSTYKLDRDAQKILGLDWTTLVNQLQTRELTAVQVLSAFIAKSLEATAVCNAVTEYNPKAMEIAKQLDNLPEVKGPLHGVPFCVKDDTNLEGMDSTLGFAKNCYNPSDKSAALVLTLEHLGGVPFCKTNVPQTLLSFGSDNPIFGQTTSSHNTKLGPGGSSSGTGALVGSLGAFFGTGTDIGGSLRLPAHCNGVASLKPTAGRLSSRGVSATLPNIMGLDATTGIIGQNAKIVSSVYKGILSECLQSKFDPRVLPIPWDEQSYTSKKKLRIGYITQSEFYPPIGDTIETIEKAVEALKSQGHTLIPVELPDGARVMRCAANFILADDQKAVGKLLKGEEVAKCAELNALSLKVPHWTMKLFSYLMQRKTLLPFLYSKTLGSMLDAGSFKSDQLWDNTSEKKKLQEEMFADWAKHELDCCVLPVLPFPAVPLNLPGLLPVATLYTMTWNVVDFPAGVVKFGVESGKKIDDYDWQGDQALKLGKQACLESIGSPIGVQVVALPFREELVLRVMEELDNYATEQKFFA